MNDPAPVARLSSPAEPPTEPAVRYVTRADKMAPALTTEGVEWIEEEATVFLAARHYRPASVADFFPEMHAAAHLSLPRLGAEVRVVLVGRRTNRFDDGAFRFWASAAVKGGPETPLCDLAVEDGALLLRFLEDGVEVSSPADALAARVRATPTCRELDGFHRELIAVTTASFVRHVFSRRP